MEWYTYFAKLIENISLLHVIEFCFAIAFGIWGIRKLSQIIIDHHERTKTKDAQLAEALAAVKKYPEYRQQSLDIQQKWMAIQQENSDRLDKIEQRIEIVEEERKLREQNRLREILLRNYQHYTSHLTNPNQSWTQVESDTFWQLFKDYESLGGNGLMHEKVRPAMLALEIINE